MKKIFIGWLKNSYISFKKVLDNFPVPTIIEVRQMYNEFVGYKMKKDGVFMNHVLFYRCEKCGNIVALVTAGGGVLNCCGQPMTELKANSTDGAQEKHVPVAVKRGNKVEVTVGSVPHPMVKEHYIEWIALVSGDRIEIKYLQPGMQPVAEFAMLPAQSETIFTGENDEEVLNCEGQPCNFVCPAEQPKPICVYEYCNLHGLWKSEL